jgi:hypothetical protein
MKYSKPDHVPVIRIRSKVKWHIPNNLSDGMGFDMDAVKDVKSLVLYQKKFHDNYYDSNGIDCFYV